MATYMTLERALIRLDEADKALAETMSTLDEPSLREPSLLPGWTRAHVLAHLARNADALSRLAGWAATGREAAAYDSVDKRNQDIEEGSHQDLAHLRADVKTASHAFRQRVEHLRGRTDLAQVTTGSTTVLMPGDQIPWIRLREVVFHHVDLGTGFSFADVPSDVLHSGVVEAVDRLNRNPAVPHVTLLGSDGRRANLGGGGQEVNGTPAQLLGWLSRGVGAGLSSHQPLPELPSWG